MHYDFDRIIDRSGTNSLKWDCRAGELPMWVADMDFETAPEITEALAARAAHGVFGYSTVPDAWYDAYTGWWNGRHGTDFRRGELIFSTGVIPTISSCVRKLTTPAENVVILTPVYNIFRNCIFNNGRNIVECPLIYDGGAYAIDFGLLEEKLSDPQTTLLLFCNPHNPIGKIWDKQTLARVGELAAANGVTVISDEIHCDLTDPGKDYIPFAAASETCARISVTCIAPTKTFNLAGLQTSAAVVRDPQLRHRVWRALNTDECGEPNAFAVQAAVAAFTKGGPWLEALRAYLYENKRIVRDFLASELSEIRLVPSEATYLLWLDCAALGREPGTLAKDIRRRTGLWLSDGKQYGSGAQFLRMNIACPAERVRDGLHRLREALHSEVKA